MAKRNAPLCDNAARIGAPWRKCFGHPLHTADRSRRAIKCDFAAEAAHTEMIPLCFDRI
jgi:hypothetical protein